MYVAKKMMNNNAMKSNRMIMIIPILVLKLVKILSRKMNQAMTELLIIKKGNVIKIDNKNQKK